MNRIEEVIKFIEFDSNSNRYIESEEHYESIKQRLFDIIHDYEPRIIVKAGLGSGKMLLELAAKTKAYIVVVEPSLSGIKRFLDSHKDDASLQKINFINGEFHEFPVDYYKADLIICIDYLDIFDSSRCIDEFKRALAFDGILFLCTIILDDNDTEGIYDDFLHMISPLHNDYYLEKDLKTFLELKEFSFIKSMLLKFSKNLKEEMDWLQSFYKNDLDAGAKEFLDTNKGVMQKSYGLTDELTILEPYFMGYFKRNKPIKSSTIV